MNETTLEQNIKDCIQKELEKGVIEKILSEKLEDCISKSVSGLFEYNGEIKKVIEEKIKSTMVPYLENYDYSEYIIKIDSVMTEILKELSLENRKILENFKHLVTPSKSKEITTKEIFKEYTEYCLEKIDKRDLENYGAEDCYITCNMSVEIEISSFSNTEDIKITFECEDDESLNLELILWKSNDKLLMLKRNYRDITSLKNLNKFDILMMKIENGYSDIKINDTYLFDEIFVEYEGY